MHRTTLRSACTHRESAQKSLPAQALRCAALTLLLLACAGTQSAQRAPEHPALAVLAPSVAKVEASVPSDPLQLVPGSALLVANLQISALTQARSFPIWRAWLARYACVDEAELAWVTTHTTRAVLVGRGEPKDPHWLAILEGHYGAEDVGRALALVGGQLGAPAAMGGAQKRGRFSVLGTPQLSAALLDERLLLVGDAPLLDEALDLIAQPAPPRFADDTDFLGLAARVECLQRSVCVLAAPAGGIAAALYRELSGFGMNGLGAALAHGRSAFGLDLRQGVVLGGVAHVRSEKEAQDVVKQLNDWIWQIGVFSRLAGFPDVLDSAKVSADGELALLDVQVSEADLAQLTDRVAKVLESDDPPSCNATAQQPGPTL